MKLKLRAPVFAALKHRLFIRCETIKKYVSVIQTFHHSLSSPAQQQKQSPANVSGCSKNLKSKQKIYPVFPLGMRHSSKAFGGSKIF